MSAIREEVIAFIADKVRVDRSRIGLSTYFMADLGLSSLRSMELICDFEDRFEVKIPENEIHKLIRVGDLIAFVESGGFQECGAII
jgi:acyl carrier protein